MSGGPVDPERDDVIWLDPPPVSRHTADESDDAVVLTPGDGPEPPAPPAPRPLRGRLLTIGGVALVAVAGIVALRTGVDPPLPPVTAPDGQVIRAFHDPELVQPPVRPEHPPRPPGEIRSDPRQGGATVWWPPGSHGYEVRWGPAGQEPTESRVVTSSGATFHGLRPGRYRVDVRSVDEIGQRSEPRSAEFDALADEPAWVADLGFAEDLRVDGAIDHDRWNLPAAPGSCLRRGPGGPLIMGDLCPESVSPTSSLRLGEPDADGVRGRVVIVTDTPAPLVRADGLLPSPDMMWESSGLVVNLGPGDHGMWGDDSVTLVLGAGSANLSTRHDLDVEPSRPIEVTNGPGVLHRWELVFTTDEVIALRNGERIVTRPFEHDWTEARLTLGVIGDGTSSAKAQVAFVGLTGDPPDGRPTTTVRPVIEIGRDVPAVFGRVDATPTAETAVLTGVAVRYATGTTDPRPPQAEPPSSTGVPPLQVVITVDGVPLTEVRQRPSDSYSESTAQFSAVVPIDAVRRGADVSVSTTDGGPMQVFDIRLDVTHLAGTRIDPLPLAGVLERPESAFARPAVIVRRDGELVNGGEPFKPGPVDIEVRLDAGRADDGSIGWLAVRVELDGKPILDMPTATDGRSAVLGVYRFTIDLTDVDREYQTLLVRVVPDRAGVTPTTERVTLRSRR